MAKLGKAQSVTAIAPAGLWARRDPWRCVGQALGLRTDLGRLTRRLTERALTSEAGQTRLLRSTVAKPLNLTQDEARDLIETYNSAPTFTTHHSRRRGAAASTAVSPSRSRSRWPGATGEAHPALRAAETTSCPTHTKHGHAHAAAATSRSGMTSIR